ncbi:TRADD-N-associated membrane domain-containing protein [Anatilimnocola floriformis]|uniref:TRADD-N-associated membrane domain-containing protein n=1 Tax=Anatilimnocola floriformis TaxID=2948575 RepID=UPI0020C41436|nr:hypothetical protein [Anatilimnocola floriformis]
MAESAAEEDPTSQLVRDRSPEPGLRRKQIINAVLIVFTAAVITATIAVAQTDTKYFGSLAFLKTPIIGLLAGASLGAAAATIPEIYPMKKELDTLSSLQVQRATERMASEPEKAQPAWELARSTLQLYFNRNLSQVNSIFYLATAVMAGGFILIGYGVWLAMNYKESAAGPILAGAAGVLSQFIGATFLFIYKSTLQQADKFVQQLERMNTIGMAMQILDTMQNDASESNLKDKTKAKLIDLFVRHAHSDQGSVQSPLPGLSATSAP